MLSNAGSELSRAARPNRMMSSPQKNGGFGTYILPSSSSETAEEVAAACGSTTEERRRELPPVADRVVVAVSRSVQYDLGSL